jgi:hypothetical protein
MNYKWSDFGNGVAFFLCEIITVILKQYHPIKKFLIAIGTHEFITTVTT